MAFGVVFINNNPGFDWCMVEDDWGRTPAIRYKAANILIFPMGMIAKRVEAQETFDVPTLYEELCTGTEDIIEDVFGL